MRRIAALIAIMLVSTLYASTITSDGSFPDYAMAAIGRAVDESTAGRGNLDISISSYSEDDSYFPDMIHGSFSIGFNGTDTEINAVGHDREELSDAIEAEIVSLLYYEESLLSSGLRLDYIHKGSFSFLSDEYYRRGTRFDAIDADGRLRGVFEISDSYPGVYVLSPIFLDNPFPGISLESEGEWTMFGSAAMGFSFPSVDMTGSLSFGRTDLIYPFVPLVSFLFRYDDGAMYWYGGIGLEAFLDIHRIFPSVSFTLIEEGRIGADAAILLGGGPSGFDWKGRFSVFYEHRATPSFFWRIGYENIQGEHMLMIGMGGDF